MTLQTHPTTAYDATLFEDNFPAGIENHYWFRARTMVLHRALQDAGRRGWLPASPSILEVGCGPGVVVRGLAERGHDVRGVELGRPTRQLAAERMCTGCRAQDLDPAILSGVDAMMALDVIEHVPDDVSFLSDTLACLPRCRVVVVTVPARPELWSNHDRYYGHFRRYTRRSLAQAMRAAGLEVARTRYVFRALYAAAALIKVSGRERDPILRAPGNTVVQRGLAAGLDVEDRLLSDLPIPGLSVLGIGLRRT